MEAIEQAIRKAGEEYDRRKASRRHEDEKLARAIRLLKAVRANSASIYSIQYSVVTELNKEIDEFLDEIGPISKN